MHAIERQLYFPQEDLTTPNAHLLQQLLLDPKLTHAVGPENPDSHMENLLERLSLNPDTLITETAHVEHTHTHNTFMGSGRGVALNTRLGFSLGYTLYEITTSLVAPRTLHTRSTPASMAIRSLDDAIRTYTVNDYLDVKKEALINEQPIAAELIGSSAAARAGADAAEHALLGAAVRRQIELDSREYTQSLVQ